jgi:sarcosine oxidase
MARARELWRELEDRSGRHLSDRCSSLSIGPRRSEFIETLVDRYRRDPTEHELLDNRQLTARYPAFRAGPDSVGLIEEDTLVLRPEAVIAAEIDLAAGAGAEFAFGERVLRWEAEGTRVFVETEARGLQADRVVITVGPWISEVSGLDLTIDVERQVTGWFSPPATEAFSSLPVFVCSSGSPTVWLYGVPDLDGDGVKAAYHHGGTIVHPDSVSREVTPADVSTIRTALQEWIPALDALPIRTQTCMYTNTPDLRYALGVHPGSERVLVGGGGSGHGFRLSNVMGEVLADLVEGKRRFDLAAFRLGRLVRQQEGRGL